jgi:N-methylhydantoinase A
VRDFSQTIRKPIRHPQHILQDCAGVFRALELRGVRDLRQEGFTPGQIRRVRLLDLRYTGQSFELTLPAGNAVLREFHRMHERRYGYADVSREVEIVNVRVRLFGHTPKPSLPRKPMRGASAAGALIGECKARFSTKGYRTLVYDRNLLHAGNRLNGPAVIVEYSATTLVPPGWRARVDAVENIVLERSR